MCGTGGDRGEVPLEQPQTEPCQSAPPGLRFRQQVLPGAFRTMLVKSTRIDKREDYSKVKIVKALRNMVGIEEEGIRINPDLFSLSIQYRFISKLGSTFEAVLCLNEHS